MISLRHVPYKQNTISGCASYSLANLWDDPRFIEDVDSLQYGECLADMNVKMTKYMPTVFISTIFCTNSKFTENHNRLFDPLCFDIHWDKLEVSLCEQS